jgi:hypothetical protein
LELSDLRFRFLAKNNGLIRGKKEKESSKKCINHFHKTYCSANDQKIFSIEVQHGKWKHDVVEKNTFKQYNVSRERLFNIFHTIHNFTFVLMKLQKIKLFGF